MKAFAELSPLISFFLSSSFLLLFSLGFILDTRLWITWNQGEVRLSRMFRQGNQTLCIPWPALRTLHCMVKELHVLSYVCTRRQFGQNKQLDIVRAQDLVCYLLRELIVTLLTRKPYLESVPDKRAEPE